MLGNLRECHVFFGNFESTIRDQIILHNLSIYLIIYLGPDYPSSSLQSQASSPLKNILFFNKEKQNNFKKTYCDINDICTYMYHKAAKWNCCRNPYKEFINPCSTKIFGWEVTDLYLYIHIIVVISSSRTYGRADGQAYGYIRTDGKSNLYRFSVSTIIYFSRIIKSINWIRKS